ncbi:UPF0728 protein v1g117062-like [Plodia interpunctella]|uniref:UPF0728 protein v1g117062-like n=1 Tax=Plodia interpunctella TaxID=58824 RepID=UPI0023679549|nr:UPF0728 protein v1g117062-like [Plodia interpunctella]
MAMTQCVIIYYGPYNSFYTLSYKPQKLTGLINRLQRLEFRVELVPVKFEDFCVLAVSGHEVFRCNIRNLKFNTPYCLDPVCQRAVAAVLDSVTKVTRARNRLWFQTLLLDKGILQGKYALEDHNVDRRKNKELVRKLSRVETCLKCCNVGMEND